MHVPVQYAAAIAPYGETLRLLERQAARLFPLLRPFGWLAVAIEPGPQQAG
jgi:hypothetical protein